MINQRKRLRYRYCSSKRRMLLETKNKAYMSKLRQIIEKLVKWLKRAWKGASLSRQEKNQLTTLNLSQLCLQSDEKKWKRIVRKWCKQHLRRMSRIDLSKISSIQSRNIQVNHMCRIQLMEIVYWSKIKTVRQHIRILWNNRSSWLKVSLTLITNHWTKAKSLLS